jgi:hypothetical protein
VLECYDYCCFFLFTCYFILVVDLRDARIFFFHMVKAIVRLNKSSPFLDIYQMLFVSLIYLSNL